MQQNLQQTLKTITDKYTPLFANNAIQLLIYDIPSDIFTVVCNNCKKPRENIYIVYHDPFGVNAYINPTTKKYSDDMTINRYFCKSFEEVETVLDFLAQHIETLIL